MTGFDIAVTVIAAGVVYMMAFAIDVIAVAVSFIAPSADIYEAVNSSVIFKYFF